MDCKSAQIFNDTFLWSDYSNETENYSYGLMDSQFENRYYQPQPNSHIFSFEVRISKDALRDDIARCLFGEVK